jgi:hypothetical protein
MSGSGPDAVLDPRPEPGPARNAPLRHGCRWRHEPYRQPSGADPIPRAADVRSILGAGAGVPGLTAEPGDALVLDLPAVPVRPLADYAIGGLS